jgi:CheY-like chemotaxis protein
MVSENSARRVLGRVESSLGRPRQDSGVRLSGSETAVAPRSVLIVDSSEAARRTLADTFQEEGYRADTATCLAEACELAADMETAPNLAVLTFRLSDGRGDQVAALLRLRWSQLFVLYSSRLLPDDDHALKHALELPRTALMLIPTSLSTLVEAEGTDACRGAARAVREGRSR